MDSNYPAGRAADEIIMNIFPLGRITTEAYNVLWERVEKVIQKAINEAIKQHEEEN